MIKNTNTKDNSHRLDLRDPFILDDIQRTNYQEGDEVNSEAVVCDMEKVMAYTNSPFLYYVKTLEKGSLRIEILKNKEMMEILKSISVGQEIIQIPVGKKDSSGNRLYKTISNPITLFSLLNQGTGVNAIKTRFLVRDIKFISNEPLVLSIFRGYNYSPVKEVKIDLIKPFLDHVFNIITAGDQNLYEYVLNWISFMIQKPGEKIGTALLLISDQGTGKTVFFTDVLCKLTEGYSIPNENKIENIVGRFNSSIENKVLIVCNELQSIENARYLNSDALKSIITERNIRYDTKHVKVRDGENVANLIFVSNNILPLKIDNGDRRYVVINCSDASKGKDEYFDYLAKSFTNAFYQHLFTFFLDRTITKFKS